MTTVELRNLHKSFGAVGAVRGVDLTVRSGEFMVLVGPSGCGKSTLLRLIAGLDAPDAGEVLFDGQPVTRVEPSRRGIAMVFQGHALYPHMTVRENMAFGLKLAGLPRSEIEARVRDAAEKLQIGELLARLPRELSGGQRQRVAIGRAIVREPRVFLFDEPLSNLDAGLRVAMRVEIARLHRGLKGATMIYVTHDQAEAMTLGDRICMLRDGRIEQAGSPADLYERPRTLAVAGFIGFPRMNLLPGGDVPTVGVRPEDVEVAESGPWAGEVVHVEDLGADRYLHVDIGMPEPMILRSARKVPLGARLSLRADPARLHRFDAQGRRIG